MKANEMNLYESPVAEEINVVYENNIVSVCAANEGGNEDPIVGCPTDCSTVDECGSDV